MLKQFFSLQWKAFYRSAAFKTNLAIKILMVFGALYFLVVFLAMGLGTYYFIEKQGLGDPFILVNTYLIFYLAVDLYIRYMMQKMPVLNIKPLLYLPFKKNQVVFYSLGKTLLSFFNWVHAFFFIPFSIVLVYEGYNILGVVSWHLSIMALFFCNNFLNVLMNNKDIVFYPVIVLFAFVGISQYYQWLDLSTYISPLFRAFYNTPWTIVIPVFLLIGLAFVSFRYFKKNLYLDAGLSIKHSQAKIEDYSWLNRFGNLGTFLKNDIKLIKRNKRSRTTVVMSFLFLFYGLLFFTGSIEVYDGPIWKIFAGIFISGGFLFSFGQFVPSWDSSYYPLMMSQNIRYKEYLNSKWYLIVLATIVSTILSTFYLYFGWEAYLAILVGAAYNVGVNSYLVLWGGAYIKTPIDLTSNKNAFGDKQAFNAKTLLLTIPKLVLPLLIYSLGHYLVNPTAGYIFVAVSGFIGLAFKDIAFRKIESIYKKEKYKTLNAYKQKGN